MGPDFFRQEPKKVAKALIGTTLISGSVRAIILETQGFKRQEKERPIYQPFHTLPPGSVYCPRIYNAVLFVIGVAPDGISGGRVLIRGIKINGEAIVGPGNVSARLGITEHGTKGSVEWVGEDTLSFKRE